MNVELNNGNGGLSPPTAGISCRLCPSLPVCRIVAAFTPLVDPKEFGGEAPILPEHLAIICSAFHSKEPITVNYEPEYPQATTRLPEVE